ncbi:MAG TPA: HD domain-containing protein [Verrucomicrobiae bacterium]|nr:HD domain-containing protein [Verrucomicrobiae bacterium]
MHPPELDHLEEWFIAYCRSFYTGDAEHDRNISLKEQHSLRVRENAALLAGSSQLASADGRLIAAVALLHDVGRFEQYRRYGTFRDAESVNHGTLGARILREQGVLDRLAAGERAAVLAGVALHNALSVAPALRPEALLLTRVVRDADKLDIWRVFLDFFSLPKQERASAALLGFPERGRCTPATLESLRRGRMVRLSEVQSVEDFQLLQLSWVFDLNYPAAAELFLERGIAAAYARLLPDDAEVTAALDAVRVHASVLASAGERADC